MAEMKATRKIGFIDYYLSEWHANNYPAWIRELDPSFEVAYAWAEVEVSPVDGVTTDEWCAKFGAARCATIEEVCEKADFLIVLSPDNPERHLDYAKRVFPCGKPCYMDKTFAPDAKTAKEIFALAERYGVKLFSSSALRFADELREWQEPLRSVTVSGAGRLDNYLIHFVEIAVRLMGADVRSVMALSGGRNTVLAMKYRDGRVANLCLYDSRHAPGFEVSPESADPAKRLDYIRIGGDFFKRLIAAILSMFDGAEVPVKSEETVTVIGVMEAARRAAASPWVEVEV
ncbi:MAG TPA: hypothetical protein DDW30_01720 [Clostridiales bacterium]|nr:hypothetical protein [Clostridiales bacterium]